MRHDRFLCPQMVAWQRTHGTAGVFLATGPLRFRSDALWLPSDVVTVTQSMKRNARFTCLTFHTARRDAARSFCAAQTYLALRGELVLQVLILYSHLPDERLLELKHRSEALVLVLPGCFAVHSHK